MITAEPRHDREEAERRIKWAHLWHDEVAHPDADAEARASVAECNQRKAQGREAEERRLAEGRFYMAEAASLIAHQRGLREGWEEHIREEWEGQFAGAMLKAAEDGAMTVRDPATMLPVGHGRQQSLARIVTRDDVNAWLDAQGAGYRWEGAQQPGPVPPKPLQHWPAQEAAILAKLVELGFDPQALPAAPPGKASPAKQRVRGALDYSPDVMNKAWQRLRNEGGIKDAKP